MYDQPTADAALARVRELCLALPEASERLSHGSPSFFVREKKGFVHFVDDHHGDGRLAIYCAAPVGEQEQLIDGDPGRYFRPPYVGVHGWVGVLLHPEPDWDEVGELVIEAWRAVAPKRLIAAFDAEHDAD